jgi:hypothetical protein
LRGGIRAAQNGEDPRRDDGVIATYAHDRVISDNPPAPSESEDRQLLWEVARNVVTEMVRSAHHKRS